MVMQASEKNHVLAVVEFPSQGIGGAVVEEGMDLYLLSSTKQALTGARAAPPYRPSIAVPYQNAPLLALSLLFLAVRPVGAACVDPECAPTEGWDTFANNLGSDLAPLLTLFGEQITTQFLNESMGALDSLLFALGPLGIITAMVAAIRVAGKPVLRSLIGRAKESRGTVEADLMSSTSSDVCELWNGEGVVRVIGSPILLQLVYDETDTAGNSAGIYTFREAVKRALFQKKQASETSPLLTPDTELYSDVENLLARQNPPNLSLNVSIKPLPRPVMMVFVAVGLVLQSGVLAFAAVMQYQIQLPKNGIPVSNYRYGFPVLCAGTLCLAVGMFMCAQVIETSTDEDVYTSAAGPKTVIWLQQGGQKVGDQLFESFARRYDGEAHTIITSQKVGKSAGRSSLAAIAVFTTLAGFITQLFGFRWMHSSVIVMQVGVVVIMTTLRSCARLQRESQNDISDPDGVEGYELDWLAKNLKKCATWEVITGRELADEVVGKEKNTPLPPPPAGIDAATAVMKIRARLARLSTDWKLETRVKADILQNAIEMTMNEAVASLGLNDDFKDLGEFKWVVPVNARFGEEQLPRSWKVELTLKRTRDENSNWRMWKTDSSELEAVLCLWISSLTEFDRALAKNGEARLKSVRLLGLATQTAKVDYRLWIHRGTTTGQTVVGRDDTRYFGCFAGPAKDSTSWQISAQSEYLFVDTDRSLGVLCAQEVYALFLFGLVKHVTEVGGSTERRTSPTAGIPAGPADEGDGWAQSRLINTHLGSLAGLFFESGLGSIEEAYFCIIPAFSSVGKLPYPHEAYSQARKASKRLEMEGKWEGAIEIDSWLYSSSRSTNAPSCVIKIIEAEIENRLLKLSQKVATDVVDPDTLQRMWDLLHSQCQIISDPRVSEDRAFALITLCMTHHKTEQKLSPTGMSQLVSDTMQSLGASEIGITERILDALTAGSFDDAETFARFLWSNATTGKPLASKLLTDVRRRTGDLLCGTELKQYLSDPESLRSAAETTADTTVPTNPAEEAKIPIDLLLVRGYQTPLQMAAETGQEGIVRQLLDAKSDVNAKPAELHGRTALQAAAGGGHIEIVKLLLEKNASVNDSPAPRSGRTALQAAAEAGHEETAKLLLDKGADVDAPPAADSGRTALQAAAAVGHEKIVMLLLASKADVNAGPAEKCGRTALQAAAEAGHEEILKLILKSGADIETPTKGQGEKTALILAAENGHEKSVEVLFKNKADITGTDGIGRMAIHFAAQNGHEEVVKLLLKRGMKAGATTKNKSRKTPLILAAENGHEDMVGLLLKSKANVDAATKDHQRTALHHAALTGNERVVERLLKHGADIDNKDSDQHTPLYLAVENGHEKAAEVLLKNRADITGKDADGDTTMLCAARLGHNKIVGMLLKDDPDLTEADNRARTALIGAAYGGHERVVEMLVQNGADIPAADQDGRTALIAAAQFGHEKVVELLLTNGADIGSIDRHSCTALDLAAGGAHEQVVEILIKNEAHTRDTYHQGRKALNLAVQSGSEKVVELLLGIGADTSGKDDEGRPTIIIAAYEGQQQMVQMLVDKGADVMATDQDGRTALIAAAQFGHEKVVELLLANGADIGSIDRNSCTALDLAAGGGHEQVVEILIKNEAHTRDTYHQGRKALNLAVRSGSEKVVELLLGIGADMAGTDTQGHPTIIIAADEGLVEVVEMLLRHGAEMVTTDPNGRTALAAAAQGGRDQVVELLLAAGADTTTVTIDHNRSALHLAAHGGHEKVVALFLNNNVDLAGKDKDERTALHLAVENGHETVVGMLLKGGADMEGTDNRGRTALIIAAGEGHEKVVQILLENGADMTVTDRQDQTALHLAAHHGQERLAEMLLDHGADIAAVAGGSKRTALHLAVRNGHPEVMEMLLKHGADIEGADTEGSTAIILAAQTGQEEKLVEILLRYGADIECADNDQRTALYIAVEQGTETVTGVLLKNGADIAKGYKGDGYTVLHLAAEHGLYKVVDVLLQNGADAGALTLGNWRTPLHLAARFGMVKAAESLVKHGADIEKRDRDGQLPLGLAQWKLHWEVVKLLQDSQRRG